MRLFIALRPPRLIREALLEACGGIEGARWQDDEQLHMTTRFVGDVDGRTVDDLCIALGSIAASAAEARISGAGMFDRRGRPEAVWAGVSPREPLAALHRKIDRACVTAGLPPESRAYVPHVTLARLGRGIDPAQASAWVARHQSLMSDPFRFDRLILYRSRLGDAGAAYEVLDAWPLRRA